MPNRQPKSRILLDWFTVSYRTVVLGGVGILVAVSLLAWWLWFAPSGARAEAQDAIHRAEDKVAEASTYPAEPRADEVRRNARVALEESRTAYANSQWEGARVAAIRAENYAQKAIDMARGEGTADREVRIFRMEGDVRVKRAGEFAWEAADRKMKLRVGDQIKTAANASAQIIYFDGTITTVEAGSLLEIRQVVEDPATRVRQVKEKLSWGEIMASTQRGNVRGSFHEVATEAVSARSEDGGQFRVAVDKDQGTARFDALTGTVQLATPDRKETLEAGERLRATPEGRLLAKESLPAAPRLVAPSDQRVFVHENPGEARTTLSWEAVPGVRRYRLLISNRPLFTNPLYDADREDTNAVLDGVPAGEYFWKVASISGAGVRGPFSEERRFRVSSQKIRDREDDTPPDLQITEKVQTGSMLILNGRTEPGAVLWVDNEKVEVSEDGTFYAVVRLRKEGVNDVAITAQDAAGNVRKLTQRAYVDSF